MRLNKTKRKSKKKKITKKQSNNKINKIFVLSFYKERRQKYKNNKIYEIYEATPKNKIPKSVENQYSFYYIYMCVLLLYIYVCFTFIYFFSIYKINQIYLSIYRKIY